MIDAKKMQQRLKTAVAGNVSKWCRDNGLFAQRANVGEMVRGNRKISKVVLDKLGYYKVFGYEKKQPK